MLHYMLCVILFTHAGSISEEVSVCLGGQLTLNCSTNEALLQWTIAIPNHIPDHDIRFISANNNISRVNALITDAADFVFLRTSISPQLVSMILIENVTVGLNGTRVSCSSGGEVISTTKINVIKNGIVHSILITNLLIIYATIIIYIQLPLF